jgi:hypothetical protein
LLFDPTLSISVLASAQMIPLLEKAAGGLRVFSGDIMRRWRGSLLLAVGFTTVMRTR